VSRMAAEEPQSVSRKIAGQAFAPTGFFVLRTPLYPFAEFLEWGEGLQARTAQAGGADLRDALAADRRLLRDRIRRAVARPEAAEAIFLASPDLEDRFSAWLDEPDGEKGQRIELALVRYYIRMACRPTPFGLFAGCSVGPIGESTRLVVSSRREYGRTSRLDMDYLSALTTEIEKDPEIRSRLRFYPNTSLYDAAGRWRYAESRLDETGRNYHLVAVEKTDYLLRALTRAAAGVRAEELVGELLGMDPDIDPAEAAEFVTELISSQLLISELDLPVTGPEVINYLIDRLAPVATAQTLAESLRAARGRLQDFDRQRLGIPPQRYRDFADGLQSLPAKVTLKTLIQVDMVKPAPKASLGRRPVQEVLKGVEVLHQLAASAGPSPLSSFMDEFRRRYEDREVPLVEALDEEIGIGFMRSNAPSAEASPLLAGLAFPPPPGDEKTPWGQRHLYLLRKLDEAWTEGRTVIEIETDKIAKFAARDPLPLPDAFSAMAVLAAPSPEAVDAGDFQVLLSGFSGPSGARLLGRFCHLDPDLQAWVEAHLREEESHKPDAVYAEVVHLPQGRIGNILFRPVLREHEIPFLGHSTVARDQQIPVTDLRVSVRAGRLVLRSQRLDREVVPRLTSAHNFGGRNLGIYKFLCSLQSQGVFGGGGWSWDALDSAPFLPRVVCGRLVLARARWRIFGDEIEMLTGHEGAEGFAAIQAWRHRRRLPRLVELVEGDNSLTLDLDNTLCVEVLRQVIKNRSLAILRELFPGPDQLVAQGPEGLFVHEIVVPFAKIPVASTGSSAAKPLSSAATSGGAIASAASVAPPYLQRSDRVGTGAVSRSFLPGSEWLYAKLYCGTSNADQILREVVEPLTAAALASGAATNWFFVRYGDPDWHIRLRIQGAPSRLAMEVLPLLHEAAAPLLEDGRLWRLQLDTYEREIERYGGPEGIELAERIFRADSEAVLGIVGRLAGDAGADVRWRLTLRGVDMILSDLGLDPTEKLGVMERMRESYWQEFHGHKGLKKQLGARFRKEREALTELVTGAADGENPWLEGQALLALRRERHAEAIAELKAREKAGRLSLPLSWLASSFVHMHANRLLRSAARAQELVIYEFLCRIYSSEIARQRKRDTRSHA
jgi:thiopeptide-type bacteriocin biosynthesis protein